MPCLIVEMEDDREFEIQLTSATLKAAYEFMQEANISRVSELSGISRQAVSTIRDNQVNVGIDKLGALFDAYHRMQDT